MPNYESFRSFALEINHWYFLMHFWSHCIELCPKNNGHRALKPIRWKKGCQFWKLSNWESGPITRHSWKFWKSWKFLHHPTIESLRLLICHCTPSPFFSKDHFSVLFMKVGEITHGSKSLQPNKTSKKILFHICFRRLLNQIWFSALCYNIHLYLLHKTPTTTKFL